MAINASYPATSLSLPEISARLHKLNRMQPNWASTRHRFGTFCISKVCNFRLWFVAQNYVMSQVETMERLNGVSDSFPHVESSSLHAAPNFWALTVETHWLFVLFSFSYHMRTSDIPSLCPLDEDHDPGWPASAERWDQSLQARNSAAPTGNSIKI